MIHKVSATLPSMIIENKDVEIVVSENGRKMGTLLISRGRIEWKRAKKSLKKHSYTWKNFDALLERDKKPPKPGKNGAAQPNGNRRKRGIYIGDRFLKRPRLVWIGAKELELVGGLPRGGATNGTHIGSGPGHVNVGLKIKGGPEKKRMVFPAGFSMIAEDDAYQNGILVQDVSFDLPADDRSQFVLQMYCANQSREKADSKAKYKIGPVLKLPGLKKLFKLLHGRRIPAEMTETVQDAVWEVTDGDGLEPETRKTLATI